MLCCSPGVRRELRASSKPVDSQLVARSLLLGNTACPLPKVIRRQNEELFLRIPVILGRPGLFLVLRSGDDALRPARMGSSQVRRFWRRRECVSECGERCRARLSEEICTRSTCGHSFLIRRAHDSLDAKCRPWIEDTRQGVHPHGAAPRRHSASLGGWTVCCQIDPRQALTLDGKRTR